MEIGHNQRLEDFEAGYRTAMEYVGKFGSADTYMQLTSLFKKYREVYEDKITGSRRTYCFDSPPPEV